MNSVEFGNSHSSREPRRTFCLSLESFEMLIDSPISLLMARLCLQLLGICISNKIIRYDHIQHKLPKGEKYDLIKVVILFSKVGFFPGTSGVLITSSENFQDSLKCCTNVIIQRTKTLKRTSENLKTFWDSLK